MEYQTAILNNGLRVIHRHSPSQVVFCGYEMKAGAADELPGEEGLAHFCEHLSFKGTERRTALDVINCLEGVGGELNAFTTKSDTVFYSAVLKEHLSRAIDLLSDIVFHSVYPIEEIKKEVEVICDEIESYNDSPAELIYDDFENILFGGTPLGHNILGEAERVRKFTREDAVRFTSRLYRPDNAIFFIDGDVDFEEVIGILKPTPTLPIGRENQMEKKEDNTKKNTLSFTHPTEWEGGGFHIRHLSTHQAHVMVGTRAYDYNDKRRMPLYLLNNILGGPSMSARLNLALRERNGLVYTVESTMVSYASAGIWSVYFGCDEHDIDRCLELVHKELNHFIEEKLTEEELSKAKQQIKGQLGIACDNRENFSLDYGKSFLHFGKEKDLDHLYAQIDAITAEEIQNVARELFPKEKLTTLIYK